VSEAAELGLEQAQAVARPARPGWTSATVPRFAHGSRVPGWDEAADLAKDPAGVPDPQSVAVPAALREEIEAHMRDYPDPRSAALPALAAA
jgi:NADH-quinone oxidoreductase subunit E